MDPEQLNDSVDSAATENTGSEGHEIKEWGQEEVQEPEQAQPEAGEEEGDDPEKSEPEKPKKSRAQERIEQTTRENAELKRKLAEYEAKQNAPKTAEKPVKPKIDDFETYDEYLEKYSKYEDELDEWRVNEATRRIQEQTAKETAEKSQTQKQAEMQGAIAAFAEQAPDFDEVIQNCLDRGFHMPITLDEVSAEFGYDAATQARLLYEVAKDEEFHLAVSESSKLKAAKLLSDRVDSWSKKPNTPPVSKAPPPIKPLKANTPAVRDPNNMTDDEWYEAEKLKRKKG